MGKYWVEVCLISARGLRRSSSLWKLQWFAVGWIDPNNKYCTKIDASGNANPVWKTKFAVLVDDSQSQSQPTLHVEVYSREPIFLRERLQGTASVVLKEFLAKQAKNNINRGEGSTSMSVTVEQEEVGSYQLRKKNSSKPQGFVDISIRISEEREEPSSSSYIGNEEGFMLTDHNNITLATEDRPKPAIVPSHRPGNHLQTNFPYTHPNPMPFPPNYSNSYVSVEGPSYPPPAVGPSYRPPRTPPPPPPPSNVGYIPTFLPRTDQSYINMPPSGRGRGGGPGFGMGLGAGALAAGAVIFGDDFMSGFDVPGGGFQDASLIISTDPPF
ncbi:actin cytoskeleton-regulatory complex protein PAN1 [Quercus robur]|uniref:C2 domain-containing protein n=1 Tax=Quercus lobata TaxID=97700 RepID=A0A7N2ME95_QUELO|nr:actin cytoskeleton-regulatory complex protein PAN1 [Quercus lobata]XP_030929297.1 actin cytoskeleton-regulatory complex protein PAN1 [Quercus lobata]XP_030929298.1 actin cytoskeleton-regulatory complex protein PAN1 [Quercus lobata]XP_050250997.1 actin cytoskeleton-regulatory complex protein PAN1 [Quercus robur]